MSLKRKKKQKERKVWALDRRKNKWVQVSSRNPNCEWENGIFVRK